MSTRLIHELRKKYPGLDKKSRGNPLGAIQLFCIECMGGVKSEVNICTCNECPLYDYRLGDNPYRKKVQLSKERKIQLSEHMRSLRLKKNLETLQ